MKSSFANKKLIIAALLLIALAGGFSHLYFSGDTRNTENAYIQADVVNVASRVAGSVIAVHVTNNQHVHKGDALFDLDPEPYEIALAKAQANLALAVQGARQDNAQISVVQAEVEQRQSDLANAIRISARDQKLLAQHFLSEQSVEDAQTRTEGLKAALDQARAKLIKASVVPTKVENRGDVLKAQAAIDQAKLDLQHTHVTAVQDGQIDNLSLTVGATVGQGVPLFALIEKNSFYIEANFKETQLPGIHPGESVDILIDMYPGKSFKGKVVSISGGTGTAFSLLPPQNATGNWVKIAQRVPVRIAFAPTDSELRIGATATVTVHLN